MNNQMKMQAEPTHVIPSGIRIAFVFAALSLMVTGCGFEPVKSPEWPSSKFGEGSNAIIRIGVTSRDIVLQKFGKPAYATQHDLAWGYLLAVKTGKAKGLLMGPCMPYVGSSDVWKSDDIWLQFDESGILQRVEKHLVEKNDNNTETAWRAFTKTVPDKIRPEQMSDKRP